MDGAMSAGRFDAVARYTRTAVVLHWLIALMIIVNTALGLSFSRVPDAMVRPFIDMHKSLGITVMVLAFARLAWRATHRPPPLPAGYARWEHATAHVAHWALYGLIFALPISGWLHDSAWGLASTHPIYLFGLIPWPRIWFVMGPESPAQDQLHSALAVVHNWFGFALDALLALHVLGALKHQFIDRHPEFRRMAP